MTLSSLLDAAGRRRSPATRPDYYAGRPPRNKGMRYPADQLARLNRLPPARPRSVNGRPSPEKRSRAF